MQTTRYSGSSRDELAGGICGTISASVWPHSNPPGTASDGGTEQELWAGCVSVLARYYYYYDNTNGILCCDAQVNVYAALVCIYDCIDIELRKHTGILTTR